jgi:hypothetical protein
LALGSGSRERTNVCYGSKADIAPQRRNAILKLPHSIAKIIALMIAPQNQKGRSRTSAMALVSDRCS